MEPASSEQESPSERLKTDRATAVAVGKGSRGSSKVLETAKGQSIEDRSQSQRRRRGRCMGTVLTRCSPKWVSNSSTGSIPSLYHTEPRSKDERLTRREPEATRLAADAWSTVQVEQVSEVVFAASPPHPGILKFPPPFKWKCNKNNSLRGTCAARVRNAVPFPLKRHPQRGRSLCTQRQASEKIRAIFLGLELTIDDDRGTARPTVFLRPQLLDSLTPLQLSEWAA